MAIKQELVRLQASVMGKGNPYVASPLMSDNRLRRI